MSTQFRWCVCAIALSACTATRNEALAGAALGSSLEPRVAVASVGSEEQGGIEGADLSLWHDPAFRRQFTASYLAETEIEPTVTLPERDVMQNVMQRLATDKVDEAIALLQKSLNPASSAVFDFTLANLYFQREQLEPAARSYEAAVEKHPKFRRAWKNLALIHVRRGAFEPAAQALTKVLELGGSDAITFGLLGFAHSNLEQHLAAESAYRMACLLDPATKDWQMGLARSLFKQRRYADAAALCDDMLAGDPQRADLWLLQANAFIGLGQPQRAAQNFEVVDRLGGATAESLESLGDIYVNEELFDLAVAAYGRALEKRPEARPLRALRAAKVMTARGALDDVRALIARIEVVAGATLDPADRKDLLKLRARIAVAEGGSEEEARVLEEIVALDPLDGEALILLGQHAGRIGDHGKAVLYFERAAGLEAFEADAKVRHAQLLVGLGRYAEALPLLRRAQELQPRENIQQYLEKIERVAQTR